MPQKIKFALIASVLLACGNTAPGTLCLAGTPQGLVTSTVASQFIPVANDVRTNWQTAGLVSIGGIPSRTKQCGATINPIGRGSDDLSNIQAAIKACKAGGVVQLGSGTFSISGQVANHHILLAKGVSLRGTGTCNNGSSPYCSTVLNITPGGANQTYFLTGSANCTGCSNIAGPVIMMAPVDTVNGNQPNWTGCSWGSVCTGNVGTVALDADGTQGQTTIQVHSLTGFSAGMFVRVDEASGATTYTGPLGASIFAAADLTSSTASPATGKIAYAGATVEDGQAYGALYDRETSEIKKIASIGAGPCPGTSCTLTFDSALTINYRHSSPYYAQIYQPANAFVQQAGVENLSIVGAIGGQGGGPIRMDMCAYCWIKNVETAYWIGGVILTNSIRAQVTGSYFHDCSDCENNGNEYPLAMDGATTESLLDNNIFRLAGKGMVGRACGGGNVVANNYQDDTFYQASSIGDYWLDAGVNGSHYTGCHHTLFEGNSGDNGDNDNTHGNVVYHTYYKNSLTGLRSNFIDPSFANPSSSTYNASRASVSDISGVSYQNGGSYPHTPGERHAAGTMAEDYWMAFVGNVLGTSGQTTARNGWTYQYNGQKDKTIWELGWVGGGTVDPNLTGAPGSYIWRHGNFDYFNGAIADWQTGYSQSLPNSLYLSSTPAYFGPGATCTYTWPWVTPQSSPYILTNSCGGSGLPAKARWNAGTPFVQP